MSSKTNNEPMSTEEANKKRKEITDWYKKQIPHLKVQAEYEGLMTQIEESRAKRVQAQAFLADAYMQMEGAKEDSGNMSANQEEAKKDFEESMPVRKLKVEKSES